MKIKKSLLWALAGLTLTLLSLFACDQGLVAVSNAYDAALTPAAVPATTPPDPLLVAAAKAPASVVDTRSVMELRVAACTGFDGAWRCSGQRPKVFGASTQPIIPVAQTIPAWFVDPANVTGTASDGNDCVTSATQCLTFQEIEVHRWGTYYPRLQQATTINVWSSEAAGSLDFLYLDPYIEGGNLVVQCNLGATQQIATGTIQAGGFVAKNRSGPMLLQVNAGATALHQLVVNATHSSRAWTAKTIGGGVFAMTEPINPITVPSVVLGGTSNDNWAIGDTVTVYQPATIHLGEAKPRISKFTAGDNNLALYVYQCNATTPTSGGVVAINAQTIFVESSSYGPSFSPVVSDGNNRQGLTFANVNAAFSDLESYAGASVIALAGGQWDFGFMAGASLSNDVLIGVGGTSSLLLQGPGQSLIGAAYIDTGSLLSLVQPVRGDLSAGGSTLVLWGPGGANVRGNGRLFYPPGAGAAAAAFLFTGTLSVNSQTKTCIAQPGAATIGVCNTTLSATNLDTNGGATPNCLVALGGGAICNYGP